MAQYLISLAKPFGRRTDPCLSHVGGGGAGFSRDPIESKPLGPPDTAIMDLQLQRSRRTSLHNAQTPGGSETEEGR